MKYYFVWIYYSLIFENETWLLDLTWIFVKYVLNLIPSLIIIKNVESVGQSRSKIE